MASKSRLSARPSASLIASNRAAVEFLGLRDLAGLHLAGGLVEDAHEALAGLLDLVAVLVLHREDADVNAEVAAQQLLAERAVELVGQASLGLGGHAADQLYPRGGDGDEAGALQAIDRVAVLVGELVEAAFLILQFEVGVGTGDILERPFVTVGLDQHGQRRQTARVVGPGQIQGDEEGSPG